MVFTFKWNSAVRRHGYHNFSHLQSNQFMSWAKATIFIAYLLLYPVDITHYIIFNYYTGYFYATNNVKNVTWRPVLPCVDCDEQTSIFRMFFFFFFNLFIYFLLFLFFLFFYFFFFFFYKIRVTQFYSPNEICDKKNLPWSVIWYDLYPTRR
jgi:hypothetical protein